MDRHNFTNNRGRNHGGRGRNNTRGSRTPPIIKKRYQDGHKSIRITPPENVKIMATAKYELEDLAMLRGRLNETKSRLDIYYVGSRTNKELEQKWIFFQSIVDIYKPMRREITNKYNGKHVTNAWMKYWELYSHYNIIPTNTDMPAHTYTAFFNAELPGAALCAFNHYMKTMRRDIPFDWRASSLVPVGGVNDIEALGDIYGLARNNRDKWIMDTSLLAESGTTPSGYINNGDATNIDNLYDFAAKLGPDSEIGGVDLYSHDAGIDVSTDGAGGLGFNQQELANAKIHFGCALAGFMTMRPGATFIAKQYTFFETFTWNLILIYANLFEEFYICKPLTSRPYNSEIYLIGIGYRGIGDELLDLLLDRLRNFNTNPLIPADSTCMIQQSVGDVRSFARTIFTQQISFIEENIELFEKYKYNLSTLRLGVSGLQKKLIETWFDKYPVGKIKDEDQLNSN